LPAGDLFPAWQFGSVAEQANPAAGASPFSAKIRGKTNEIAARGSAGFLPLVGIARGALRHDLEIDRLRHVRRRRKRQFRKAFDSAADIVVDLRAAAGGLSTGGGR
jgi:hypothetical protein